MRRRRATLSLATASTVALGLAVAPGTATFADDASTRRSCDNIATAALAKMGLKHKIGQLVMSQPGSGALPGEAVRQQIEEWGFGSWIIQNRGGEAANVARYTNQMQAWAADSGAGVPLLIGADMESGAEQQVPDATSMAYPMGIGATRDVRASATAGEITGAEAAAMGVNWNFMPVADVNTKPENPVIGVRSFGEKPDLVSEHVTVYTAAQQEENVLASAKHFPGHGDTETDSHLGLPTVTYNRQTLEDVHLKPFQAAIDAGLDSVMTSHVVVEAVDADRPATLSRAVLTDLLREEMGFDGLVITDGMGMSAISERWGTGEAAVLAVQAGADIILAGDTAEVTAEAIHQAVRDGEISEERVDRSVLRILRTKCDYGLFDQRQVDPAVADEFVGNAGHMLKATRIGQQSVTMLENDGVLPLTDERVVHVAGPELADHLATSLTERGIQADATQTPREPDAAAIADATERAQNADVVIATTYTFDTTPDEQHELVDALIATGRPVVVVSLGIPYGLASAADANASIATYALNVNAVLPETVLEGLADVLAGRAAPGGSLPVTVSDRYPYGSGITYDDVFPGD